MDLPVQMAMRYLEDLLPPTSLEYLNVYILHPDSPFQTIRRSLAASLAGLYPLLAILADKITQFALNSPDVVLIVFLLGVLLLAIQILNWTRRMVVSLTRLVFNLMFYAVLIGIAAFMYQRGLEASIHDMFLVGGKVWGYALGIKDVFLREYERYAEEERRNSLRNGAGGRGGAGGRAASGWR